MANQWTKRRDYWDTRRKIDSLFTTGLLIAAGPASRLTDAEYVKWLNWTAKRFGLRDPVLNEAIIFENYRRLYPRYPKTFLVK